MFSDFDAKSGREDGRGRRTVSLLLAASIFVALAVAISFAIATAHAVVQRREREVDVEFAALEPSAPEPPPVVEPPPPAPPPPPRRRRPPRGRTLDAPPSSIPDARPAEAEGTLVDPGPVRPGSEDGVEGGQGPVPPPEPEPPPPPPPPPPPRPVPRPAQERIEVSPPRMRSGCRVPERPDALEGATAETITLYVRVVVGPDGRVLRARLEEGHPLVPERTILSCVQSRIYEPARLPDSTAVPYPLRYAFTFRPDVL